jgi:replication factor C subunit 1
VRNYRDCPSKATFFDYWVQAAESISQSEMISNLIRGPNQDWWLSPAYGIFSTVLPAYYCHGAMNGRLDFPSWFGSHSKMQKTNRLARELSIHSFLKLKITWKTFLSQLAPLITQNILDALEDNNVENAVQVLIKFNLTREDFDSLLDLANKDENLNSRWSKIPTTVKSAFTRRYNTSSHLLPYSLDKSSSVIKRVATDFLGGENGEDEEVELEKAEPDVEEEDSLENNKMIKVKKTVSGSSSAAAPKKPRAKKS